MENIKTESNSTGVTTTKVVNGAKYDVEIHFSKTSKETLKDKLLKLIVRDYENEMYQTRLENLEDGSSR